MLSDENQVCSCLMQPDLKIDKEYFCSHINILIQRREAGIKQQLTDIYSPELLEKIPNQIIMDFLFAYMAEEDSFDVKKFILMIKSYHKLLSGPEIKPLIKVLDEIKNIIDTSTNRYGFAPKELDRKLPLVGVDTNDPGYDKDKILDDLKVLDQRLAKVFFKNADMYPMVEYEINHCNEILIKCKLDCNLGQTVIVIEVVKLMEEIKDCAKKYSLLNDRDFAEYYNMNEDEIDSAVDAESEHETELDNKLLEMLPRYYNYMQEDILAMLNNLNQDPVFIVQGITLFNNSVAFLQNK
jgi:hypothetical protein